MPHASTPAPPRPAWLLGGLALYLAVMALQAACSPPRAAATTSRRCCSRSRSHGATSRRTRRPSTGSPAPPPGVAGPALPAIYALRLAGVFLTFAGLYAIARRLQPDPLLAACAGLAMLATLHFHWYLLFYLTNTTFAMALGPARRPRALPPQRPPDAASYALFGAVIGLGSSAATTTRSSPRARSPPPSPRRTGAPASSARRRSCSLADRPAHAPPHVAWVAQNWTVLSGQVGARSSAPRPPPYARARARRPREPRRAPRSAS